jgi:manganese/zinc/iron transport system permease protein
MNFWDYFTDPILRAPTLGCILLCTAAALMGAVLFFQRRLMVSESISHAAYPGAVLGILVLSLFGPEYEEYSFIAVLFGACFTSWLGLRVISYLERRQKIKSDPALCLTLAIFFGVGILLASWLQESAPMWVSQVSSLLYGQAATLTDAHVLIYGSLAFICLSVVTLAFRPLQTLLFDRAYAKTIGIQTKTVERLLFWLLLVSIVAGIRSVGVILMSGMLIAPVIVARQFSDRLKTVFFLSAIVGAFSGWIGNVLSVEIALKYEHIHIPTGPMIVLVGSVLAILSMLFSPKRGVFFRLARLALFRLRCLEENVMKGIWKKGKIDKTELKRLYPNSSFAIHRLIRQGWVVREGRSLCLTEDGRIKAGTIVRLHRLWELYLTEELGCHAGRVHHNAEDMEHILTPELERRLTKLLSNPQNDPHQQPIPNGSLV